ncbi:MAG TPA: hypothetical protein VHP56_12255 [Solirubrobacterales bacterium]|jgi:hypothetical protein|nr:hypothetical protein [Solirubrobacterales bacterium]
MPRRQEESRETPAFRERIGNLLGRTRKARLLTLGTALALIVAVVAFIALPEDDDGLPYDAYAKAADRLCVAQKQAIVEAGQESLTGPDRGLEAYAGRLVPIVVEWRAALNGLNAPADRSALAEEMSYALRQVAVKAGALARVARVESKAEAAKAAGAVDEATAAVETSIADLGLRRCADLRVTLVRNPA